jgi:hypothetical protein
VDDGVLLDVDGAVRSNEKLSSGLSKAAFSAAAQTAVLGAEILKTNLASESTGLLRTTFCAGDNGFDDLVDVREIEANVEFSISGIGGVGT